MHSDIEEPINIGSDEMVTINQLVDIVEEIAGVKLKRNYKLDAPKGVRGPQQRQYANQGEASLGAEHFATHGNGTDVSLDLRPS